MGVKEKTKDLYQKTFVSFSDVSADSINAMLYEGRHAVNAENLLGAPTETTYRADSGMHSQFEDIKKFEIIDGRINAVYQIENQSRVDRYMLLRKAGYAGATYKEQYDKKITDVCPVIGMVLYWGKGAWKKQNRTMRRLFREKNLPEGAWKYIDNMRLHVFQMRRLPEHIRCRFTSDMRIVVDYLADAESITRSTQPVKHPEELCGMLYCLSDDKRFLDVWAQHMEATRSREEKGEQVTMCKVLDDYWNGGVAQGVAQGIVQGETKGKSEDIIDLLEELGVLPAGLKRRISEEKNLDVLSQWVKWAARAGSIDEFESKLSC